MNFSIKYFTLFLILTVLFSCSENSDNQGNNSDNYNRQALLSNLANNIILPAHTSFNDGLANFSSNVSIFNQDRNIDNLLNVQEHFVEVYRLWQHIEMFNIGLAEEIYFIQKMNIYPANVTRIQNNMNSDNIDLDSNPNQYSSQGFPAIDYLLFGMAESNDLILNLYVENEIYINYLILLVEKMVSNSEAVLEYWEDNRQDFINSTGNTTTSSLNMLTNDFIYYYEKGFRANKIGIPAGVWSGDLPQNVEAYYKSNISKLLAIEALNASKNFFLGKHYGSQADGEGLYDYLGYLDDTNYSDSSMFVGLNDDIISSFDNSMQKLMLLNDNFALQIQTDNIKMLEAYDAIQEGVVRLKTNMLSILGISVDYFDADGD
tara:strand:+ start:1356 stop:2480 length:1125 start_codon:yes stop_codon:yes gene_type:complete